MQSMALIKNRDYVIIDGENDTTVVAECSHCHEPWTIEGRIREHLYEEDKTVDKFYCRGADGLSHNIICCIILNCVAKKGHYCNLIAIPRGKRYGINKEWNVIVAEPAPENIET